VEGARALPGSKNPLLITMRTGRRWSGEKAEAPSNRREYAKREGSNRGTQLSLFREFIGVGEKGKKEGIFQKTPTLLGL